HLIAGLRGQCAVVGYESECVTVDAADDRVSRTAEPGRIGGDRVEHRLHVRGRSRNDPKDLTHRRLLLERFAKFAIARFEFLEQANVLDRDDRLVGKGLQQSDLLVGEWPGFGPDDSNGEDRVPLVYERKGKDTAKT